MTADPAVDAVGHLYVHLPFCAHRCGYCDFVTVVGREGEHGSYVDALLAELGRERHVLAEHVATIFLGGGTPTFTQPAALGRLLAALPPATELTIEANPETVTPALAALLRDRGRHTRLGRGADVRPGAPAYARACCRAGRRPARGSYSPRCQFRQHLSRPGLRHPGAGARRPRSGSRGGARARARASLRVRARGEARHTLHGRLRGRARPPGRGHGGVLRARRRDADRCRLPLVRDGELLPRERAGGRP